MPFRCWIGVASREHVLRGVEAGFVHLSRGNRAAFRFGLPEVSPDDFARVARAMDAAGAGSAAAAG